jgi:uncharacterized glyoxalase superfamily protein PhnB
MATRKAGGASRATKRASQGRTKTRPVSRARALAPRRQPASLRLRAVTPSLTADDLGRSLAFYTEVLGFIVGERWTSSEGKLRGVMLKAGACEVGLTQDDWAKGRNRTKGEGMRIWCQTVQDVDALAARVRRAGFTLAEAPMDQPWGARSFSVDDPDGFHLTIFREQ